METRLLKFSKRLNALVIADGNDVEKIANATGQNLFDIYHWKSEKCRYMPSLTQAVLLANYFGCSLAFLLGEESENSLQAPKRDLPEFSSRLKKILSEKGMPIQRLSRLSQLSGTTVVYSWLNGKSLPRIDSLLQISKTLGCSPDYLIGREE